LAKVINTLCEYFTATEKAPAAVTSCILQYILPTVMIAYFATAINDAYGCGKISYHNSWQKLLYA
jgi:hypothetical protein